MTDNGELRRIAALLVVDRHAQARALISRGLAESPDSADLHALMARSLVSSNEPLAGLPYAERACALEPHAADHHRLRAVALWKSGRAQRGLLAMEEALRLSPNAWNLHAVHSQIAADLGGRSGVARESARRAVELAPWAAAAHFAAGYAAHAAGRRREALASYRRTLQIDPTHAMAHNNIGVLRKRRLGASTQHYLTALRSDPQQSTARHNLDRYIPRLAVRVRIAGITLFLVGSMLTLAPDGVGSRPTPASAAVGLAVPVLVVGYVVVSLRRFPSALVRDLVSRTVKDVSGFLGLFVALALMVLGVVMCTVPDGIAMTSPLVVPIILVNIVSIAVRRRR